MRTACLTVLVLGALASLATAQVILEVPSEPSCKPCRIELTRIVELGDDEGPGILGEYALIKRDSRGRYYATDQQDPGVIKVFDPQGRFLRSIGRKGGGPGEYQFIPFFHVGAGDSLHIFDLATERYTVLSPGYDVARTEIIPARPVPDGYVLLDNGDLVLCGVRSAQGSYRLPLHRFTRSGAFVNSFGTPDEGMDPRTLQWRIWRRLAPSRANGLWSVRLTQFVVELWDADGTRRRTLIRRPSWFPPSDTIVPLSPERPPQPRVFGVREDSAGRVWVLVQVGDKRWRRWIERQEGGHGTVYIPTMEERVYDTVLEVIDAEQGRLIASRTLDQQFLGFIDPERIYSLRIGGASIAYDVWRVRVSGP